MADHSPSKTPFKLPDDVHVLAHLRDQLGDYLSTLERNTDSIREWLDEQQNNIILGHHRLVRAIELDKDEKKAIKILGELGETTGFILGLQDFAALARTRFGDNSALEQALNAAPRGYPADILEDLPKIRVPKPGDTVEAIGLNTRVEIPAAPEPEEKKGFWSQIGNMFKGEDPEEEARRKEEAIKRHWRQLRSDLISLQSDRHYYIDSFMDWVGENLEPEDPEAAPSQTIMQQYQSPQYVIDLAQRDYDSVNKERAARLNTQALQYSALAHKLDTQDIDGFIQLMPALFPRHETPESKRSKDLLLADFGVASFAELALTHVKKDEDRVALLSAALKHEHEFKITGLKSGAQIFERVLGEVLKPEPLDAAALSLTIKKLQAEHKKFDILQLGALSDNPLYRIAQRFKDDPLQIGKVSEHILNPLSIQNPGVTHLVSSFAQQAQTGDAEGMLQTLRRTAAGNAGAEFMALWALTYPHQSIMDKLPATKAKPDMLSLMVDAALDAGVYDEWRPENNALKSAAAGSHNYNTLIGFIEDNIVSTTSGAQAFNVNTLRKVLATGFLNGGLDELRPKLTASGGWLEQVVSSGTLDEKQKLAWVAALIEPFGNDIQRANILHDAADRAQDKTAAQILSAMESRFAVNEAVRIDSDRLLTNLHRIANIWYNPEPKTLQYTVSGTGHLLQENVSQHMADETLALIQRKGGFDAEYDGLVKPENIDRIVTTHGGTKLSWQRHSTDFNGTDAQAASLHTRPDFVHATDAASGATFSINQKAVLLIHPLDDGTNLLIDKYGHAEVLGSDVTVDAATSLSDLGGGAWFNPHNASVISLDSAKNTLSFRVESRDFDDFLENADSGEYLYAVHLGSAAAREKIEAVIAGDSAFAVPVDGSDTLALNLRALAYLQFDNADPDNTGFSCRKYGPTRKPGFVHTEDADFATAIFDGMQKAKDVIVVENLIAHKSMIEDAYYNAEKQTFYMVIGQDILDTRTDDKTAYAALKKLAAEKGFETVGVNLIDNPVPNGIGHIEVPADVINLSRATMIAYNAAQDQTSVHTDQDKYHVNLDRMQARTLMQGIEKDNTPKPKAGDKLAWTADLSKALKLAAPFEVAARPGLANDTPVYLLSQLFPGSSATQKVPTIDKDFSVAAAAVKTGEKIFYPHIRQPSQHYASGAGKSKRHISF